jgi:hypothetical protein
MNIFILYVKTHDKNLKTYEHIENNINLVFI